MRMQQSIAEFEAAFREEAVQSVARRERLRKEAAERARRRRHQRAERQGTLRFLGLAAAIVATAVLVTIAMFEALYYVIG
jgi:anti-sigma-K factor RskA